MPDAFSKLFSQWCYEVLAAYPDEKTYLRQHIGLLSAAERAEVLGYIEKVLRSDMTRAQLSALVAKASPCRFKGGPDTRSLLEFVVATLKAGVDKKN